MFAAGMDTTGAAVDWAMAELLANPSAMAKLREELAGTVHDAEMVEMADLAQLPYLRAVVKETLRLHPTAPLMIPHMSAHDCDQVGGYCIPKGTRVFVNVWAIGRDPEVWNDPHSFVPNRFLNVQTYCNNNSLGPDIATATATTASATASASASASASTSGSASASASTSTSASASTSASPCTVDMDLRGQHFELLPFGSGRRMCPGVDLALPNLAVIIANLIHAFDDWELPSLLDIDALQPVPDMSDECGIILRRARPLLAIPRNKRSWTYND